MSYDYDYAHVLLMCYLGPAISWSFQFYTHPTGPSKLFNEPVTFLPCTHQCQTCQTKLEKVPSVPYPNQVTKAGPLKSKFWDIAKLLSRTLYFTGFDLFVIGVLKAKKVWQVLSSPFHRIPISSRFLTYVTTFIALWVLSGYCFDLNHTKSCFISTCWGVRFCWESCRVL